jgi:hypothetical protein
MKHRALSAFLPLALAGLVLASPDGPDPAGVWKVMKEGNPVGTVTIEAAPKGNRRYMLSWEVPEGNYTGIGLVRDNHLYAAWGAKANGVMVVRREGNHWAADWLGTTQSHQELGSEKFKGGGEALEGTHEVEGKNPNGSAYTGSVTIEKTGDTYAFTWTVAGETYPGIGIDVGEGKVLVAYGKNNFGVIAYDMSNMDEVVQGRWAAHGQRVIGIERIRRRR